MRKTSRLLLALGVVMACGGGDATAPQQQTGTTGGTGSTGGTGGTGGSTGTPSLSASVTVADNSFSPTPVTILKGGTVTWNFSTGTGHTVTFDDQTTSGTMTGGTYSRTFTTAGSYNYQCSIHYGMYGQVVVQ